MSDNVYQTPQAELVPEQNRVVSCYYVVAKTKFFVLFIATIGMYSLYWAYKNWRNYKEATGENVWPLPRAFFQVFFTHRLFQQIDDVLTEEKIEYQWSPSGNATLYVIALVVSSVTEKIAGEGIGPPFLQWVSLAMLPLQVWFLWAAQRAINIGAGDENGEQNSSFSLLNWIWVVLGLMFWGFIFYMFFAIASFAAG